MNAGTSQEGVRVEPSEAAIVDALCGAGTAGAEARIMTGHQAEFWHPGILAKYMAAGAAAAAFERAGGRARVTWLVVDQDTNEGWKVRYPAVVDGRLSRGVWTLPFAGGATATSGAFAADAPVGALPVVTPPDDLERAVAALRPATEEVAAGLRAIGAALARHQGEANLARQVTAALCELCAPWCRPDDVVFASELHRAPAFGELVERMAADPAACVSAYNAGVERVPGARLRALKIDGSRIELPLWRMPTAQGRSRRPVFSEELAAIPRDQLVPRALFMTALLRMSACDLFIHGTGGGVYDRVTELWLERWLPGTRLAPTAVVTATRWLSLGVTVRSPEEIARAHWLRQHARHSPGALGDAAGEERRRGLVAAVKSARSEGRDPGAAYRELHGFLESVRSHRARELERIEQDAEAAAAEASVAEVVYDRTWPFPLHGRGVLDGLKAEIERAFGARS